VSSKNIDALRGVIAAFNSGDLDRILAVVQPHVEAKIPPELSAEPDTYIGRDGVRRYFETFWEAMQDVRFEPLGLWEAGDAVVADMRLTARGRSTDIAVEQRIGQVWTLRDGRVLRVLTYPTLAQAQRAAGLPRADGEADA
jgi:ketosteroid isomerase-like protein